MELPLLDFPKYNFTIKASDKGKDGFKIFDKIRLKYVTLTPEEWVRQHLVTYLYTDLGFPKGLIAIEKGITINDLYKRFDALVYNLNHTPAILIECKAPSVQLNQDVFDQAARYNYALRVPYLMVSNGLQTYLTAVDHAACTYHFFEKVPAYMELFPG
jgi:hypothetical protein